MGIVVSFILKHKGYFGNFAATLPEVYLPLNNDHKRIVFIYFFYIDNLLQALYSAFTWLLLIKVSVKIRVILKTWGYSGVFAVVSLLYKSFQSDLKINHLIR